MSYPFVARREIFISHFWNISPGSKCLLTSSNNKASNTFVCVQCSRCVDKVLRGNKENELESQLILLNSYFAVYLKESITQCVEWLRSIQSDNSHSCVISFAHGLYNDMLIIVLENWGRHESRVACYNWSETRFPLWIWAPTPCWRQSWWRTLRDSSDPGYRDPSYTSCTRHHQHCVNL